MAESGKMPFRFQLDITLSLLFILSSSLIQQTACEIPCPRTEGSRLAHLCANLNSLPEDGPPVIMLHGLTDTKETWDGIYENIPFLSHRRVCIYDARNHGDSDWNNTFSIEALADDLERFMDSMNIKRAAIVGHSMGGWTAMKFALRNPDKVERLFVEDISPDVSNDIIAFLPVYLRAVAKSVDVVPEDADESTAKKLILDYITKAVDIPQADHLFRKFPLCRREGKWQWKSNYEVFIKAFENPETFFSKYEGTFEGKTVFIYGTASMFKVGDRKDEIRRLFPKAEFVAIEGADHSIHPYYPDFLQELVKFLK